MEVFYFIEYLQEFKDLYTKEEYKELHTIRLEDLGKIDSSIDAKLHGLF